MKKYLDMLLVFITSFLFSLSLFSSNCRIYLQNGFDYQAMFVWDYNVAVGLIPYKDIFYPYGIISYYKDHAFFAHLLYLLLLPIALTLLYFSLKKLFNSIYLTSITLLFFCVFVTTFIGWEVFNRYGVLMAMCLYFTEYIYGQKKHKNWYFLMVGVISGLCFSFITDIGVYTILFFVFILGIQPLLYKEWQKYTSFSYYSEFSKNISKFFLGICIGIIPLVIFLSHKSAVVDFMYSVTQWSEVALYAKTPFLPSLYSIENIFILSLLFLSVFFLSFTFLFKSHLTIRFLYREIALVVIIIILEQKSIIRSMDRTITFIGFLLACLLLYRLLVYLKAAKWKQLPIATMYSLFLIIAALAAGYLIWSGPLKTHLYVPAVNRIFSSEKACLQENLSYFDKNTSYKEIVNFLTKQSDFNKKIFSFPFDPVLYVYLQQKTPYYSNTYDSSSLQAQEKQIAFIQRENIQYIVVNTNIQALQDGVPEYVRANKELQFITNNYIPIKTINNFLILRKKTGTNDFFGKDYAKLYPNYYHDLLTIDLKSIPREEGLYKYNDIMKNGKIIASGNLPAVNKYLASNAVRSKDIFIAIFTNKSTTIEIQTMDGHTTTVYFNRCSTDKPCVIHLARLPLFFHERQLSLLGKVSSNEKIEIISSQNNSAW